jgi:hypothetical protein
MRPRRGRSKIESGFGVPKAGNANRRRTDAAAAASAIGPCAVTFVCQRDARRTVGANVEQRLELPTVSVAAIDSSPARTACNGWVEKIALFDFANKRKYPMLFTSDGACLCTTLNPLTSSEPGTRVLWAKFPAPFASVTHVSLMFPEAEPVDDVPIGK